MPLVTLMENTPLKLAAVVLPAVLGSGTPEISTVVGIPGTSPVRVLPEVVVAVTMPEVSDRVLRPTEVEGCVRLTPVTIPEPPGAT